LEYKGYTGRMEFDDEAGAFRDSVGDYLEFCRERNKERHP